MYYSFKSQEQCTTHITNTTKRNINNNAKYACLSTLNYKNSQIYIKINLTKITKLLKSVFAQPPCHHFFIATYCDLFVRRLYNASLAAKAALPHRLLHRTACNTSTPASMGTSKIHNGRQGAPKWPTGSGKGFTPRFLGAPTNFR